MLYEQVRYCPPSCFYTLAWYRCWLIIRSSVIAVLQSQTFERKIRVWLRKTVVTVFVDKVDGRNYCSVSLFRSLSVHLDPRSLVGLVTLVAAAFPSVVSMALMHGTVAGLRGTHSSDCDIMIPDKEECWQHALDLLIQPPRSPRHILASSTLKNSASYTSLL